MRQLVWLWAILALSACNPYDRYLGEVSAGPVDPQNFPPEYLGAGGKNTVQGKGTFAAKAAFINGTAAEYFRFSYSATYLAANPLDLTALPVPLAYTFDPAATDPVPQSPLCSPTVVNPENPGADPLPPQEGNGNIFTALPYSAYVGGVAASTTYVPIVSEVPVVSHGEVCQSIKSEQALLKASTVTVSTTPNASGKPTGVPDGKVAAFAVIDPGAAVYHADGQNPSDGLGLQRWGWYGHYLLAYLNGGYIPTSGTTLVAQKLYVPRSTVSGKAAALGKGYDVLEARRGEAGYSPICQVLTYDTLVDMDPAALPRSATDVVTLYGANSGGLQPGSPPYIFCLQLP